MSLSYDQPAEVTSLSDHLAGAERRSVAEADGERIVELLRDQAKAGRLPWINAAEIARILWPELAARDMAAAKRKIRAAIQGSKIVISGPGSHGYALRERVSPEQDYEVACARYSQAMEMLRKAYRAKKAAKARMTANLPLEVQA